jgi:hypothetical protein
MTRLDCFLMRVLHSAFLLSCASTCHPSTTAAAAVVVAAIVAVLVAPPPRTRPPRRPRLPPWPQPARAPPPRGRQSRHTRPPWQRPQARPPQQPGRHTGRPCGRGRPRSEPGQPQRGRWWPRLVVVVVLLAPPHQLPPACPRPGSHRRSQGPCAPTWIAAGPRRGGRCAGGGTLTQGQGWTWRPPRPRHWPPSPRRLLPGERPCWRRHLVLRSASWTGGPGNHAVGGRGGRSSNERNGKGESEFLQKRFFFPAFLTFLTPAPPPLSTPWPTRLPLWACPWTT